MCMRARERESLSETVADQSRVNHIRSFTFMHLADAFIQSDLQCIQVIHFCQYLCSLGIEPTTFCAADAMLYN